MIVLLFENIHLVLKAEKLLKNAAIPFELIPTPKEYSKECGMSIELAQENLDPAKRTLTRIEHRAVTVADLPQA